MVKAIGVGTSVSGKVVHLVVKDEHRSNFAICDKRMIGLVITSYKPIQKKQVTCSKCQSFKLFKELKDEGEKAKRPTPPPAKKKPKPVAKTKAKKTVEEKTVTEVDAFDIEQMSNKKFKIVHVPSQRVFFQGLDGHIALALGIELNDMPIKWDGKKKPDGNFLSSCKECMEKTYAGLDLELPVPAKKPLNKAKAQAKQPSEKPQKPKKKIKRRQKQQPKAEEEKKVIRRRKGKEKTITKTSIRRREGSPPHFILQKIEKGATLGGILKELEKKFGLNQKKASAKFKGVLRRHLKSGMVVQITAHRNPNDDFFKTLKQEKKNDN